MKSNLHLPKFIRRRVPPLTHMIILVLLYFNGLSNQVYTDIIPDTVVSTPGGFYLLDLNGDGVHDFKITLSYLAVMDMHNIDILGLHESSFVAWYSIEGCVYAKAFLSGDSLTPGTPWKTGGANIANWGGITTCMHSGSFISGNDRCLGLKLVSGDTAYYGWLRIDVGNIAQWFKLKDYGYDSGPTTALFGTNTTPALVSDPANGHYCQGAAGVALLIQNSVPGQIYSLKKTATPATLATITGNGNSVQFPGFFQAGTYYVIPAPPSNQLVVVADPGPATPVLVTIPANGFYCTNAAIPGVTLQLQASQTGVIYELFKNDTSTGLTWTGDGMSHIFGTAFTQGSYHLTASLQGCSVESGTAMVTAIPPPPASFTFSPNTPAMCASVPVLFAGISLPSTGPVTWQWNFDDPLSGLANVSSLQNPSHVFEALGNGISTFHVQLVVTDANGCISSIFDTISVKQKPDATLIETSNPPGTSTFANCGVPLSNPNGIFTFSNGSSTIATNTFYTLDFGSSCASPASFNSALFSDPLTVNYNCTGNFPIVYTVEGLNGCSNTRTYQAYVGNSPVCGISTASNLYGLIPYTVVFSIQPETYSNTPETIFTLDFGDGTVETYSMSTLPPPGTSIFHTYTSCSTFPVTCSGGTPKYAFQVLFSAQNPCGTCSTSICPIIVSCPATANFTVAPNGGQGWFTGDPDSTHLLGCQTVTFSNMTTPGFYIPPNGTNPSAVMNYRWDFGDPASGADTSNLPYPGHTFTAPGAVYTVTLIAWAGPTPEPNLTADTIVKQIYIQTSPVANFTTDYQTPPSNNCVPLVVKVTNLSDEGGLGIPQYQWCVLNANSGLPVTNGYTIITPGHTGDATWPEPWFRFNMYGTYILEMTLTNSCGSSVKLSETIHVCQLPAVMFASPDAYLCEPGIMGICPTYYPTCAPGYVTYEWTVPSGVLFAAGSSAASPCPEMIFPSVGDYPVSVTINNLCGSATAAQMVHVSGTISNNIITTPLNEFCHCIFPPVTIAGSNPTGGTPSYQYQWQFSMDGSTWFNYAPGGNGQNFEIAYTLCETRYYRRIVYDQGDCMSVSNTVVLLRTPPLYNNVINHNQIICSGSTPDLLYGTTVTGGTGDIYYDWQYRLSTTGWISTGDTLQNFQPEPLTTTTMYQRIAYSGACTSVSNTLTITVEEPTNLAVYQITPQDTVCPGAEIILSGSEAGVYYLLYRNSDLAAVLQGNGYPLSFGYWNQSGEYGILAKTNSWWSACGTWMLGTLVIQSPEKYYVYSTRSNPVPSPVPMSCPGDFIIMDGSETGIIYTLHKPDGTMAELTGTGSALNWGPQYQPGTYYITGQMIATMCVDTMYGQPVISPDPMVFSMVPSGILCEPSQIGLDTCEPGITYEIVLENGSSLVPALTHYAEFPGPFIFDSALFAGQYRIKATSWGGCSVLMNGTATIVQSPSVSAGPDQVTCSGNPVQLAGSVSGGANDGVWTGGLGNFIPNRYALNAIYYPDPVETGTTVVLTLTSTNAPVCPNASDETSITIPGALVTGIAGPNQTVCTGELPESLSVTPPSGGSGTYLYQWQQQNGTSWSSIPGATGMVYTPPMSTVTTKYRVTETDAYCNPPHQTISNEVTITVVAHPSSGYTLTSTGSCPGDWIQQNNSQAGVTYELHRDGIPTGVIKSGPGPLDFGPQNTPGTYTVKATRAGSDCSVWINGSVVINPLVIPGNAGPVTGSHHVCKGLQDAPYSTPVIPGASTYIWLMPPGATISSGAGTNAIRVNFSSTFTSGNIMVYGSNPCAYGQPSLFLVQAHSLEGQVTLQNITVGNGESACYAHQQITTGSTTAPFVVQPGGNVLLKASNVIRLMPGTSAAPGSAMLASITTDCLPCSSQKIASALATVQENEDEEGALPVNGERTRMVIYPNPTDGVFRLLLTPVEPGQRVDLEIYNLQGRMVMDERFDNKPVNEFSLVHLPAGMYFIRCRTAKEGMLYGKLIKR